MGLFSKKHSIGKTIAELRKEKGWTQIELAEKLQVSDKAISKWEKDSGAPSVEFFPALAELFGVNIDYIMTGKKVEPEIITMSKIELCAKNDDVDEYKKIKTQLSFKDENGNNIFDYIFKYESKNLFKAILENQSELESFLNSKKGNVDFFEKFYFLRILCNDCSVVRDLVRLEYQNSTIDMHVGSQSKEIGYNGSRWVSVPRRIVSDRILDALLYNQETSSQIKESVTSNIHDGKSNFYSPSFIYCYLIDYAVRKGDIKTAIELIKKALIINEENSKISYDGSRYIGFVDIPKSTFDILLDNELYDLVELANSVNIIYKNRFINNMLYKNNAYVVSEDQKKANIIKKDKKLSSVEKEILLSIHDGIVCVDELLSINDFKLIKKTLNEYPIHIIEKLYSMFNKKEWKQLFEYAVDTNDTSLATAIVKRNIEEIEKSLLSYWSGTKADNLNINKKHLYINENGRRKDILPSSYGVNNINRVKTLDEVIEKLNAVKQRIIDDLSLKLDKEKTVGDLTKEYFERELGKGNTDMVIIKLCVRLEAILRCDYHYEGDLSVMIDKYCQEHGWEDDGWGYSVESECVKYLQKLRMKRNNIVHSEKNNVDLTLEELKYCIDYICKMG
ncbi:MAG: helix-turn-helix domain-containing protein [Clostridiales bacterium]|nr:helix-turn-helix domain-containing protein [Clostridiales bacterium]